MTDIPRPTPKIIETLQWAIGAAVSEFYIGADDHSDVDAARAWLDAVEEAMK